LQRKIDFIDPQVDEAALFIHLQVYESVPAKLRGFAKISAAQFLHPQVVEFSTLLTER
jgi:hypothetical protein